MATEQQRDGVMLASFATLSILQLIKEAQQKHGLRHGDYQRYRGYCGRRVRRIRKSLGFTHSHKGVSKHAAKFIHKKLSYDIVSEERYLQVAVFDAERNWSYAMQLKQEAGEDIHSRKRFHMIGKLRRAVKHTNLLETITKNCERVSRIQILNENYDSIRRETVFRNIQLCALIEETDVVTKLESQAYNSWMHGYLHFEEKHWKTSLEYFTTAKKIYEKLAEVVKISNLADLYKSRCREMLPQMRYCEYNCGSDLSRDAAMSEMINMRLKLGDDEGALQEDFDKLIAELRTKAVLDHVIHIEWASKKVAITNDSVKNFLQTLEQFNSQLMQTTEYNDKITLYEQLLSKVRDLIQLLADEQKKMGAKQTNISLSTSNIILEYLEFTRLSKTVERYVLIISHTRSQKEKKVKPQDLIRLYDSVIESCCDIMVLQGVSADAILSNVFAAKVEFYRAFRCFYLAEANKDLSKFHEANLLYDRSLQRTVNAISLLQNVGSNVSINETEDDLFQLKEQITSSKYACQANRLAEAAGDVQKMETNEETDNRPLCETLNEFRCIEPEQLLKAEQGIRVVAVPPSFIPMPNKPMFFDLALNHVKMPNLEAKISTFVSDKKETSKQDAKNENRGRNDQNEPANQGIGGMVKGWFWGKS